MFFLNNMNHLSPSEYFARIFRSISVCEHQNSGVFCFPYPEIWLRTSAR